LVNGSATKGLLVLATFAAAAIVAVQGAAGATTRLDPYGTTLLDGRKVFPIVLAKGPERDALTPEDADALDEVVGAGVNFFKVGPATIPWTSADVNDAHAWNREARERGAYTWINMATLSKVPESSQLRAVVTALKGGDRADAIGMWKGADEPRWVGTTPGELQYAYCLATSHGEEKGWCAGELPADSDHLWVTIQAPRTARSPTSTASTTTRSPGPTGSTRSCTTSAGGPTRSRRSRRTTPSGRRSRSAPAAATTNRANSCCRLCCRSAT